MHYFSYIVARAKYTPSKNLHIAHVPTISDTTKYAPNIVHLSHCVDADKMVFVAYVPLVTVLAEEVVASGGSAARRLRSALGWVLVAAAATEPVVCSGHCGGAISRD
jgi:hypothetical protein